MRVLISIFWAVAIFAVLCILSGIFYFIWVSSGHDVPPQQSARLLGPIVGIGAILLTYFGTKDRILPYTWTEFKAARVLIRVLGIIGILAALPMAISFGIGINESMKEESPQAQPLAAPKPSGIAGRVLTVGPCGCTFTAPQGWTWTQAPVPQGEAFGCSNKGTNSKIILTDSPMPGRSFPVEGMRGFMKGVKGSAEKQQVTVVNDQFQSSDQPFKDSSYRATYTLQTASGRSLNFVAYVGFIHGQLLCVQCNAGETPELVAVLKSLTELK